MAHIETDDEWDWQHKDEDHPTVGPDQTSGASGGEQSPEPIGTPHTDTQHDHGGNGQTKE